MGYRREKAGVPGMFTCDLCGRDIDHDELRIGIEASLKDRSMWDLSIAEDYYDFCTDCFMSLGFDLPKDRDAVLLKIKELQPHHIPIG